MTDEINEEVVEEVEEEVEETVEEETVEDGQEDDTQEDDGAKDKEKPWFKKRFDELTWQREQARREAEEAKALAAKLEAALGKAVQEKPEKAKPTDAPKQEDFETDNEWIDAYTEWKWEQKEIKRQQQESESKVKREKERAQETFQQTAYRVNKAGGEKYEDYDEIMSSAIISLDTAQAIFETERPEDVAYYLGKHRDQAEKIASLSPYRQAVEIGKIEAKLSTPKKKTTKAPPPISPVKGKGPTSYDPDDLLSTNPAKWIQLRNEGKI